MAALAATILPAVSAAVAVKDKNRVKERINYAYRLCFLITIPSALGFSVLSNPIYKMLKYGQGYELMLYGSVALIMLAIVQVQTSILQGAGKLYLVTMNLIFGIIGKIVTNYFLVAIPDINIKGAIIGSIVGYIISITLNSIVIRKTLKVRTRMIKYILKPLIASVVMAVAAYGIYFVITALIGHNYFVIAFSTLLSIAAGASVYFAALVLIGGVVKEDLEILPRRLHRFIPSLLMNRIY
jgi:stage V sporulation protein B